jgi:hypothetical protein
MLPSSSRKNFTWSFVDTGIERNYPAPNKRGARAIGRALDLPKKIILLECLGQSGLTLDGVGGVTAGNADRHCKVSLRDGAVPDFVAAASLPDQRAAGGAQQIPQRPIELRSHSARDRVCFAQRGDLEEQRFRRDIRVIVRQQIERHRGNLFQQFVERRRIGGGRNVVAMPAPDRRLLIPGCGNRENDRSGHLRSIARRSTLAPGRA